MLHTKRTFPDIALNERSIFDTGFALTSEASRHFRLSESVNEKVNYCLTALLVIWVFLH